jgi:hypothetical protein
MISALDRFRTGVAAEQLPCLGPQLLIPALEKALFLGFPTIVAE